MHSPFVILNEPHYLWKNSPKFAQNDNHSHSYIISYVQSSTASVRADTDMYRLSAPIWTFYRYIGFADKAIAYRYRLSVSADMVPHIGS